MHVGESMIRIIGIVLALTVSFSCSFILDYGEQPDSGNSKPDSGNSKPDSGNSKPETVTTCPSYKLPEKCETNYLNDRENCCIAGRSCQGGECIDGKCQPIVIVKMQDDTCMFGIEAVNNTLVWAAGDHKLVRTCSKDGSNIRNLSPGKNGTTTLAINGTHVYWIEFNGPYLNMAPIDGNEDSKIVAEAPVDYKAGFANLTVDAKRAYWATAQYIERGEVKLATAPGVFWAPLDGSHVGATQIAGGESKEEAKSPYGIAVDDTHLYWSEREGPNSIKRLALTNLDEEKAAVTLVKNENYPTVMAIDKERVYWLSEGKVRYYSKNDEKTGTLAHGGWGHNSIMVDDQYVYWLEINTEATLMRVPKVGGDPEIIANNQPEPWDMAQDCNTIYWTNRNKTERVGQIVKLAK
jgi:hypothetical protein